MARKASKGGKARKGKRPAAAKSGLLKAHLSALRRTDPQLAQLVAQPLAGKHLRAERAGRAERAERAERAGGAVCNLHMRGADGVEVPWYSEGPKEALDRLREDTDLRGAAVLFLFGLGLGHELRELAGDPSLRLRRIFVIEPDIDVVRAALRLTDLSRALKKGNVRILAGRTPSQLGVELSSLWADAQLLRMSQAVAVAVPEGARRFHPEYHRIAQKALQDSIAARLKGIGDSTLDAFLGLEHTLRNLPIAVAGPSLAPLADAFRGRPAILAAAGPSLAKQLDQLQAIQDEVLIVCPDTSIRPLAGAGIEPHLITSRERTPRTHKHFLDLPFQRARLAGLTLLHPKCFEAFQGRRLPTFRDAAHFAWLWPHEPRLSFRGSSGNMAYALARSLGCDPIILIGQDLAFGDDGQSHTSDTAFGDKQERYKHEPRITVPGWSGQPVTTTALWYGLLQHLQLDVAANPGRTVDCTEGGALVAGALTMPFADAIAEFVTGRPGPTPDAALDQRLTANSEAQRVAEAERLHGLVVQAGADLQAIQARCSEGLRAVQGAAASTLPARLTELPPDVGILLAEPPLADLQQRRVQLTGMAGFDHVVTPSAQAFLVPWEVELYGLQRQADHGGEVTERALAAFERWFELVGVVTTGSADLLAWGEHALHEAYPTLPPPGAPLPAETMVDIWMRENPRAKDRWSKPLR